MADVHEVQDMIFALPLIDENPKQMYEDLASYPHELIEESTPGFRLIRSENRLSSEYQTDTLEITLTCEPRRAVAFRVQGIITDPVLPATKRSIQSFLYRSPVHIHIARGLGLHILFDHFLPLYNLIITDNPKNGGDLFWWEAQVSYALREGLSVYLLRDGALVPYSEREGEWGNRVFFITDEDLGA